MSDREQGALQRLGESTSGMAESTVLAIVSAYYAGKEAGAKAARHTETTAGNETKSA